MYIKKCSIWINIFIIFPLSFFHIRFDIFKLTFTQELLHPATPEEKSTKKNNRQIWQKNIWQLTLFSSAQLNTLWAAETSLPTWGRWGTTRWTACPSARGPSPAWSAPRTSSWSAPSPSRSRGPIQWRKKSAWVLACKMSWVLVWHYLKRITEIPIVEGRWN